MVIKLSKILCIPVALMLLIAVTAVPSVACSPFSPCGSKDNAVGINNNSSVQLGEEVHTDILSGKESKTVVNTLLNNDKTYLDGILNDMNFDQNLDQATVYRISISNETSATTAYLAVIPVNTNKKDLTANTYLISSGDNKNVVVRVEGNVKHFSETMKILKENSSYQRKVNEYKKDDYVVNEDESTITEIISKSSGYSDSDGGKNNSHIALVKITLNNSTSSKSIYALVDKNKKEVVAMGTAECLMCSAIVGMIFEMGLGVAAVIGCAGICLPTAELCFPICCVVLGAMVTAGSLLGGYAVCSSNGYC